MTDMVQKVLFMALTLMTGLSLSAQTLEKMNWFNEPSQWNISGNELSMSVTPKSDYWRISHYGFTVDDAPFYYAEYGGEFEAKVKVAGDYKVGFDKAWIEIFYSFDDKEYTMMRNAWMEANCPVKIGMMGACPDGDGFNVTFSDFSVRHLPDAVRTEWLENDK